MPADKRSVRKQEELLGDSLAVLRWCLQYLEPADAAAAARRCEPVTYSALTVRVAAVLSDAGHAGPLIENVLSADKQRL